VVEEAGGQDELMLGGAQVLRFGRDLVFDASTENHRMDARWLVRHLRDRDQVHVVEIADNHIEQRMFRSLGLHSGTGFDWPSRQAAR
jgi:glycine amidinotransferase